MTRAHLGKAASPKAASKENVVETAKPSTDEVAVKKDSDNVVTTAPEIPSDSRRTHQDLGHGRPNSGTSTPCPETPQRGGAAAASALPDVVVVNSTPERAPAETRYTDENGMHPLTHKW